MKRKRRQSSWVRYAKLAVKRDKELQKEFERHEEAIRRILIRMRAEGVCVVGETA